MQTILWLERNIIAGKDEFEDEQEELKAVYNSIVDKVWLQSFRVREPTTAVCRHAERLMICPAVPIIEKVDLDDTVTIVSRFILILA